MLNYSTKGVNGVLTLNNENIKGSLLVLLACFFSSSAGTLVKLVSDNTPVYLILGITYLICLLIHSLLNIRSWKAFLKTKNIALQITRSLSGVGFYGLFFIALQSVSVLEAILLRSLSPIWIPLVSYVLTNRLIKAKEYIYIFIGFLGVIVYLNPTSFTFSLGTILGLISGMFLAISAVLTRKLNVMKEPINRTLFFSFLFPGIIFLPALVIFHEKFHVRAMLPILFIAVSSYLAIKLIITSYRYIDAVAAAPFTYTSLVFSGIYDYVIWKDSPSLVSLFGIALIVLGCYAMVRSNNAVEKKC